MFAVFKPVQNACCLISHFVSTFFLSRKFRMTQQTESDISDEILVPHTV